MTQSGKTCSIPGGIIQIMIFLIQNTVFLAKIIINLGFSYLEPFYFLCNLFKILKNELQLGELGENLQGSYQNCNGS